MVAFMTESTAAKNDLFVDLDDHMFEVFSSFIYEKCGINLPPAKKTMLSIRLNKRLKVLRIKNFEEYYSLF